jgi:uroporphyrinogen-III synthase
MPMADAAPRDTSPRLAGMRVLVTRPRRQSAALAALIEAHGGTAIRFPVIEILPVRDPQAARAAMAALDDFSLVIFMSPNAVEQGLALVKGVPRRARIAAVGEGSAAALGQAGMRNVLRPADGASSEALLALPELGADEVAGSRVLIVRGEGGRQLLGGTLSKRGARVTYAEVYRRARPEGDAGGVAERGRTGGIDAIVVTSVQGLENLFEMLGGGDAEWLERAGYVVISERLATRARAMGVRGEPVVAARADDEALVEALMRWRAGHADDGG